MSKPAKEIEIKFKLDKSTEVLLLTWLKENAVYEGKETHKEYYLDNPKKPFSFTAEQGIKDALKYLRVRMTEKGHSVCFKNWHRDPLKSDVFNWGDEYETNVEDGHIVLELLKNLGFSSITKVHKTRKKYNFKKFEIVLDNVKGLGKFAEIELKEEISDPQKGMNMIFDFLKSIGITKFTAYNRGYVSMIWNKDHDFGETISLD